MIEQNPLFPILPNDEKGNIEEENKEEEQKEGKEKDSKKEKEKDNELENLIYKREKEEKKNLQKKLIELKNNLDKTKDNSISESYEYYLNNEDITKRNIKEGTNECLMAFMFYFLAPLFGIIFLIGIFQIISLKKALSDLIKRSLKDYYQCQIRSKCNITLISNEPEYHFYDYFYDSSMNESIDFNLLMITAFIGELLLKSRGFRISSGVLSLINICSMLWIYNFDTTIKPEDKEYFSLIKVISMIGCYLLLLIGIGSSALLSQQILIDSHLKYKDYNIKKKRIDLERKKTIFNPRKAAELKPINDEKNNLLAINNKIREREKKKKKEWKKF